MTKTARIEWSYPTSINAKKFGYYKVGCWTVYVIKNGKDTAIAGFGKRDDAVKLINSL